MGWRKTGLQINTILEKWMFTWVLSSMAVGFIFHSFLANGKGSIVLLFACMTLVTALGTKFKELGYVIRHPWTIGLAFLLIHVLIPLVAFTIAKATLYAHPLYVTGIVLGASIPIGVTSVMWTGLANGDLPFALALLSVDTLLSPIVVPLTVRLIVGQTVHIPFAALFWGLVWMVVLPTIVGIAIHELSKGRVKPAIQPVAGPISKLAMLAVVAINVAVVQPTIRQGHDFSVLLITLIVIACSGYLIGHLSGVVTRLRKPTRAAMTFNVGMRNISAGITIATQYFSHDVSIPVVLAMLFQQPIATLVCWLYQHKGKSQRTHTVKFHA